MPTTSGVPGWVPADVKLAVRSDLVFTPHLSENDPHYVIEDRVRSMFYRVGLAEYTLLSLLDGHTPIRKVVQLSCSALGAQAISERDALAVCNWLIAHGLAEVAGAGGVTRRGDSDAPAGLVATLARWNPLFIQVPLIRPDRFLSVLARRLAWLASPAALAVWLMLTLPTAVLSFARWDRLVVSMHGVLTQSNWPWLVACWLALKLLHELAHGLVCKAYGGSVRSAGVMLRFLAPVAYVDVTASWRFRSKWQRIHVAAAGMLLELFIAAIAAMVWMNSEPGRLNLICFNLMLMGSLTTVLFNANPLMKFDGYYILSDLLGVPNLYSTSRDTWRAAARRWFLGLNAEPPGGSLSRRGLYLVYGGASLMWTLTLSAALVLASAKLFHGAGIVLSCLAVVTWFAVPVGQFLRFIVRGSSTEQPNRTRLVCTTGIIGALVTLTFVLAPWPGSYCAPAVVEYAPLATVRTGAAGFVRDVFVRDGDIVSAGQVLALLENLQITTELADLKLATQQAELKARIHQKNNHLAAYQAEIKNIEALEKKRQEKQSEADQLTVRAPTAGKVIGRNLDQSLGRYLRAGSELLAIANEDRKELRVSIAQDDLNAFHSSIGHDVLVHLRDGYSFRSPLLKVSPSASLELPHPSLAAPDGGPLAVQPARHTPGDALHTESPLELLAPRFTGTVALTAIPTDRLLTGTRGVARLRSTHENLGAHVFHTIARWCRSQSAATPSRPSAP